MSIWMKLAAKWVVARLKEPSTYAGLGAIVAAKGGLDAGTVSQLTGWLAAGAGLIGMILHEKNVL